MNILILTPSIDIKKGGQEKHVLDLAKILYEKGNDITLLVTDDSIPENLKFQVFKLNNLKFFGLPIIYLNHYIYFIKSKKYDICHLHHETIFGEIILLINYIFKIPTITTLHSQMIRNIPFKILDYMSLLIIGSLSKKVICLSYSISHELKKRGLNIYKCEIIPNAINISHIKKEVYNSDKKIQSGVDLLFVGRIEERKGINILIEAMEKLYNKRYNYKLFIVGHGPLGHSIQRAIKHKHLEPIITVKGYLPDKELISLYNSTKLVVIPSFYEGVPGVALEAIYLNKFIIASDIPGLKELINVPINGLLVSPKNSELLSKAIVEALNSQYYLSESMKIYNESIISQYNWENISIKILKLYAEILK